MTDCGKDVTKAYRDANITFAENPYLDWSALLTGVGREQVALEALEQEHHTLRLKAWTPVSSSVL